MGVVSTKSGRGIKFRTHYFNRTPLQEILHPPLTLPVVLHLSKIVTTVFALPPLPLPPPLSPHLLQCDRPRGERQISSDEMFQFAKENNFIKCFETSVKDGTNLTEALE